MKLLLTAKEARFLKVFLGDNDCGASTAKDLLMDNHSCQCVEDLCEVQEMNAQTVGGFISSLETKTIIAIEERDDDCDIYWVEDSFLDALVEQGMGDIDFNEIQLNLVKDY